jgi:transcriptional regulator with XRE-family HTH domain
VADSAGKRLGAALRSARKRRKLSLADVARRSANHFTASALGAYERGDRAITVERLSRLADVYGETPARLLAGDPDPTIDLDRIERGDPHGLVLDLSRLRAAEEPGALAVMEFATAIKAMRKEPTTSIVVVRHADAPILASLVGCDPVDIDGWLTTPRIPTA